MKTETAIKKIRKQYKGYVSHRRWLCFIADTVPESAYWDCPEAYGEMEMHFWPDVFYTLPTDTEPFLELVGQ